jgi:hypothetical protein
MATTHSMISNHCLLQLPLTATPSHNWPTFPDGPRYLASSRTAYPISLPTILPLLHAYPLPRTRLFQVIAYQRTSLLAPLFRLSGVMSKYIYWIYYLLMWSLKVPRAVRNNVWSWVPWNLQPRVAVLARSSSNLAASSVFSTYCWTSYLSCVSAPLSMDPWQQGLFTQILPRWRRGCKVFGREQQHICVLNMCNYIKSKISEKCVLNCKWKTQAAAILSAPVCAGGVMPFKKTVWKAYIFPVQIRLYLSSQTNDKVIEVLFKSQLFTGCTLNLMVSVQSTLPGSHL